MRAWRFLRHNRLGYDAVLLLSVQILYKLSGVVLLVVLSVACRLQISASTFLPFPWAPSLGILIEANILRSLCLLGTAALVTHRWLCPLQVSWDCSFIK